MPSPLLQDESCIAAHLGERAPKGVDDESADQEQQDGAEQGIDQDESAAGTGDTQQQSLQVAMSTQD